MVWKLNKEVKNMTHLIEDEFQNISSNNGCFDCEDDCSYGCIETCEGDCLGSYLNDI